MEVQRLQYCINQIIAQARESYQEAPERFSTTALQGLRDRIRSITSDMDALNRSCSAEAAVCFEPMGSLEPAIKDKRLDRLPPPNRPATRNRASPLAFSSASHRRHRAGGDRGEPLIAMKGRLAAKRSRNLPRPTKSIRGRSILVPVDTHAVAHMSCL